MPTRTRCAALGVIDFDTLQRFVNFHYSVTLDLFGGEISSNAGSSYTGGLKGRYEEDKGRRRSRVVAGGLRGAADRRRSVRRARHVPALTALNARLRDDYRREIEAAMARWNRIPEKFGIDRRFACRTSASIARSASSRVVTSALTARC